MIATTTPILSNESLIPTPFGELQARPQVAEFGKFISHPDYQLGQRVIHTVTRERGIITSLLLTCLPNGLPEWSYTVRWFGSTHSFDVDSLYVVPVGSEPQPGEEVFSLGTFVLDPSDSNNGGIVVAQRYNETEGYWEHRVLWASGKYEWMDCELFSFDPAQDPAVILPTPMGLASGKSGPAFEQK